MAATLIASLASQIGLEAAKKVLAGLSQGSRYEARIAAAGKLLSEGSSAIDALRKAFGSDFESVFTAVLGSPTRFTFQQGVKDYIELPRPAGDSAVSVLRDELNINLERITALCESDSKAARNYFLGVFQSWKRRYVDLLGKDDDAAETFQTIDSLLDGNRKSFADALRLLQRTGLGTGGALLIIYGAMVATSTGVGLWAWITTLVLGVPIVKVAVIVLPGALLIALATIDFDFTNGMTASIGAAYKLLERQEAEAKKRAARSPPKVTNPRKKSAGRKLAAPRPMAAGKGAEVGFSGKQRQKKAAKLRGQIQSNVP